METVSLPHLLEHPLSIVLFRDVQNSAFLRRQLLEGNTDFEYAFLDASVILSRQHVLAACFRAINDMLNGRLKSRNVHSEIVFSLSPNNNVGRAANLRYDQTDSFTKIAESFRRFGIADDTKNVLAIKVGGDATQVESHLRENVHGDVVVFSDHVLAEICDYARLRKIYRLDATTTWQDAAARKEAEVFVLGSMALKGS